MNNACRRVLLFTGNGKGKTTAALGIVLRCYGHGIPVAIIQFIKSRTDTGEAKAFESMDSVDLFVTGKGFVFDAEGDKLAEHRAAAVAGLANARRVIQESRYGAIILDEICIAVHKKLISEQDVLQLIDTAAPEAVLVLTGRYATQALIDAADTVTEMTEIKHGLKAGLKSREGIEK